MNKSPIRIAELAIELQLERLRVQEIQNARDAALHSLSESYQSIVQKNGIIAQMQQQIERNGNSTTSIGRSIQLP